MLIASFASSIVSGAISSIGRSITDQLIKSNAFLSGHLYQSISSMGDPTLNSSWFRVPYQRLFGVGLLIALLSLLSGVAMAVISGTTYESIKKIVIALPVVGVGSGGFLSFVTLGMRAADSISGWIFSTFSMALPSSGLPKGVLSKGTSGPPALLELFLQFFYFVFAGLTYLELSLRAALIYLVVALMPIALALSINPKLRSFVFRLLLLLGGVVGSKIVIAMGLGLNVAMGNSSSRGSFSLAISGTAILVLSVVSPFLLVRLLLGLENPVTPGIEAAPMRALHLASKIYKSGSEHLKGRSRSSVDLEGYSSRVALHPGTKN
ncbi:MULTISPECIES: hypothetical protein [Acidithrix]|uniref:Uncharacterized protein n=1 Tax=Acidithrix ferrooxidans TaxID=1280514 RepID=A0A0D8HLI0_9ACTN|nr:MULTISPECIES: hypothetical protein [Acidithrix]KJF17931.1 hypothetical protein AXFE_12160 [Acidithrix ferrooxidans]CAG4933831.1 unnamed protein product [Acidithrix sp. C25]